MKIIQWTAFVFILGIILVRGLRPESFALDKYSIILLFLISIPLVAPFLKKAKWFGAEFDFTENIHQLGDLVKESKKEKIKIINENEGGQPTETIKTFSAKLAMGLVEQDPNLALAALRIEIEKTLRLAYQTLINPNLSVKYGISYLVRELHTKGVIGDCQRKAFSQITKLCNEAVHGGKVSTSDATKVIDLAIELSQSFSVGYSINFQANSGYEEQGLLCEWEHCVEHFPLRKNPDDRSCPVFGHDCPGGIVIQTKCQKTINNLPNERFIKNRFQQEN